MLIVTGAYNFVLQLQCTHMFPSIVKHMKKVVFMPKPMFVWAFAYAFAALQKLLDRNFFALAYESILLCDGISQKPKQKNTF